MITEHAQLNGATGQVNVSHALPLNDPVVADINNDGKPDLVSGTRALSTAGIVLADSTYRTDFTAVADASSNNPASSSPRRTRW